MQAAPPSEMIIRDAIMERGHSGTGLYIGEVAGRQYIVDYDADGGYNKVD